jgi:outer membrane protein
METGGIIKTIISFSAAVVILLVPTVSSAATDMIDVYNLALKNDPKFLASGHQFTASQETLRQAYANILPTLTAEGSYTNSNQDIISSDNTVFDVGRTRFDAREYSLTLTQPVFNYAYFVEVRQAKSVIKQSDMEIELAGQEMISGSHDLQRQSELCKS